MGESEPINKLKNLVNKVAKTEATVLTTGENGTGKELVARELYRNSMLAKQPYIRVNCAAISETLMESEFFGHEKGLSLGLLSVEGRFELADGGTILLDEISEIAPALQANLEFCRKKNLKGSGAIKPLKLRFGCLPPQTETFWKRLRKGIFEDLYYRLNVFPIAVPALKERGDDILLLANTFLARHARRHGIEKIAFSKNCEKAIVTHHWPGNVRELENAVERAVILADEGKKIEADLLGIADSKTRGGTIMKVSSYNKESEDETIEDVERKHIKKVLESCKGNRTHAAKKLGLNVRTLRNKIKEYDLDN